VSQYQKGKTNVDFTEARYSEWQVKPGIQFSLGKPSELLKQFIQA